MIAWETGSVDSADRSVLTTEPAAVADAETAAPTSYGDYHWLSPGTRTLRPLDAGDDVKFLQARLGVRSDGYFGPDTTRALIAFREANGLPAEPEAGREVWSLLIVATSSVPQRRRWWPAPLRAAR
jgi:peptidoglycan hydrolase-like protein with peptidoglycan-binding domain